MAKNRIENGWN